MIGMTHCDKISLKMELELWGLDYLEIRLHGN